MKRLVALAIAALMLTGCASGQAAGGLGGAEKAGAAEGGADLAEEMPASSVTSESGGEATEENAAVGMVLDPPQYAQEPPELSIAVITDSGEQEMGLVKNGFSWTFTDDEGNASSLVVDCLAPWQTELTPFELSLTDAARVKLPEGAVLTKLVNYNSDGEQQRVEYQPTGEFEFPASPTGTIYCASVEFPQGRCDYVFAAVFESSANE